MHRTDENRVHLEEPLQDNVHAQNKKRECNDILFFLLFLACFIMTTFFAFQYGVDLTVRQWVVQSIDYQIVFTKGCDLMNLSQYQ